MFEIPLIDAAGTQLYPTASKFTAAFFDLDNGATYPCGNNGFGAGGNPKCIILNGDNQYGMTPTRIIMTDFTYSSQMNCRFLFMNPETNGAYFSVKVKAYGGDPSATNLYGDKFMGEWEFNDIFQVTSGGSVYTNTYTRSAYKVPTKSPWRNSTSDYVFGRSATLPIGRITLAKVLLYDSGLTLTDKLVCEATLGTANDYDDLLEYTVVNGGRIQKYGFFMRTWPTSQNFYTGGAGWELSYIKCKFYQQAHIAYFYHSTTNM